jgi:cytochrome c oxidase cbb3-type subunit III
MPSSPPVLFRRGANGPFLIMLKTGRGRRYVLLSTKSTNRTPGHFAAVLLIAMLFSGCDREKRDFRNEPVLGAESRDQIAMVALAPGNMPVPTTQNAKARFYEKNAYHLAQGKALYKTFNCNGCHSEGGGGMGPALMDDQWIYGGEIENIAATIREGRPNGMPAFRNKVPEDQILELAAYVRSMSGNVPSSAAPSRDDSPNPHPAENRQPQQPPSWSSGMPAATSAK